MFSKRLIAYLIGLVKNNRFIKEENSVREIAFKDSWFKELAYATVEVVQR